MYYWSILNKVNFSLKLISCVIFHCVFFSNISEIFRSILVLKYKKYINEYEKPLIINVPTF